MEIRFNDLLCLRCFLRIITVFYLIVYKEVDYLWPVSQVPDKIPDSYLADSVVQKMSIDNVNVKLLICYILIF